MYLSGLDELDRKILDLLTQNARYTYSELEEQLQVRLFSRSTRGVVLTSEGKMLLDYVSHGLGLIQCGEEKLAQSRQLLTGELIIGASDTVTSQFLLPHLDSFHKKYPNIHIQIISGRSHKVLGLLRSGKVDVAFASSPSEDEGLSCVPCFATHSCFVAAADYPCDFERAYSMQELAALPLILLERKASSRPDASPDQASAEGDLFASVI